MSRTARRRSVAAGAATAAALLIAVTALAVHARPAAAAPGTRDTARIAQWNAFANDNGDWNGADGTVSHRLADGRVLWTFSDTYKGPLAPGAVRAPSRRSFVNNSLVLQSSQDAGGELVSVDVRDDEGKPTAAVTPPAGGPAGSWLWTGDGVVSGTTVHKLYNAHERAPDTCYRYGAPAGTVLATFDVPAGGMPRLVSRQWVGARDTDISWGTAVLDDDDGHTYIYGNHGVIGGSPPNCGAVTHSLHIARVDRHDFAGTWEYWTRDPATGRWGWQTTGQGSPVLSSAAPEFSVTRIDGTYVLVTQVPNGAGIVSYTADTPTGFSTTAVSPVLYEAPEYATWMTYAARLQPALAPDDDTVVISYNVNSSRVSVDACAPENEIDAAVYRPRFITVPVDALLKTGGTAAIASAPPPTGPGTDSSTASGTGSGPSTLAADFPKDQVRWGTSCPQVAPTPTGVTATPAADRAGATVTWDYAGPTLNTLVYRRLSGAEAWDLLTWVPIIGAWPYPDAPPITTVPVTAEPASGTPTDVRYTDTWTGAASSIQYRVCFELWPRLGQVRNPICTNSPVV